MSRDRHGVNRRMKTGTYRCVSPGCPRLCKQQQVVCAEHWTPLPADVRYAFIGALRAIRKPGAGAAELKAYLTARRRIKDVFEAAATTT